jgi:uncharacterized membrane protein
MFRMKPIHILTVTVFLALLAVGFWLSTHKPVWNDEIYSQRHIIERMNYGELIGFKITEGNSTPLFYVLQKAFAESLDYQFPAYNYEWHYVDLPSQIILRILPNLFMSMSLAMMFFYFARYYSLWQGIYALILALSSVMVWVYWAEARPYAMWMFFTTAQMLLLLSRLRAESPKNFWFGWPR